MVLWLRYIEGEKKKKSPRVYNYFSSLSLWKIVCGAKKKYTRYYSWSYADGWPACYGHVTVNIKAYSMLVFISAYTALTV